MKSCKKSKLFLIPVILLLAAIFAVPAMAAEEFYSEPVKKTEFLQESAVSVEALDASVDLKAFTEYFLQQAASCPRQFSIRDYKIPYSMMDALREHIWYNTPEAFHCYSIGFGHNYSILTSVVIEYYSYADTASEYGACHEALTTGADYLLDGIEGNAQLTDVQKALLLHDRLAVWAEYDTEVSSDNVSDYPDKDFSAYGALGTRVAVCQGYTMAYMYLLDRVGIENEYCSSDALCHAWNIVYMDGKPYHVDVTWDDPIKDITGRVWHDNFLRSTEGLRATGHTANDYTTTPVDTTYDDAYWQDSYAAFQVLDGKLYYIDCTDRKLKCVYGDATTDILTVPGDGYHSGCDVRLSSAEGLLLYSTDTAVFAYDPVSGTSLEVYSHIQDSVNKEWIIGFTYEAGWLTLEIQVRTPAYDYYTREIRESISLPEVTQRNGWYNGYYYENNALIVNAWREDDKGRFYLSEEGTLTVDRWLYCDGNYCYVGADGYCVKNQWVQENEDWSYLDENGYAVTNDWVYTDGKTYYCDAVGYRVTGTYVIDGVEYLFGVDGALIEEDDMAIIEHPQPVYTESGNTVEFSVKTQGEVVSYRWQYQRVWKWFDTSMPGYTTDTLTVSAIGNRNGYAYRCIVTFKDGTVLYSEPAELTVRTYVEITNAPNDQVVVLGYRGQFTVVASGEGLKYQWQYKRPNSTSWHDTNMDGATLSTVMIETIKSRDGYQYRCKVTDVTGNVVYSNPATLSVLSFTSHPEEAFAVNGETVQFTVSTNVSSGFRYEWQYRKSATGTWYFTSLPGYNTAVLSVPAKGKNGYQYRCMLTGSKNSKLYSQAATLHAGDPLVISAQPVNITAAVGTTAEFTVTAANVYSFQWYYCTSTGNIWRTTSMPGADTGNLQVAVTAARNGYKYRCVIKGLDGTELITDTVTLTVK